MLHKWLKKHGKKQYIDVDKKLRKVLTEVFKQLDEDGSNSIGVNELEDALIALGLVDSREQVEKMVYDVDDDGDIYFEEFI